MLNKNRSVVKLVANIAPIFAPLPSAFFVARSGIKHLELPIIMGIIIGIVIETIGLSSVHTWLWLSDWNVRSRRTDPKSPVIYALASVIIYLLVTIVLTVVLEVFPSFAIFAPALFPCLALVGAVNLVLISQQEQRELDVELVQRERSGKRQFRLNPEQANMSVLANKDNNLDLANEVRKQKKNTTLEQLERAITEHPDMGVTELKNILGVRSRSTVYSYIKELEALGRVKRTQTTNS